MITQQPIWKLIANLGDEKYIDYGGYFVYEDTTGVYGVEVEYLLSPSSDESGVWKVYRFSIPQCTLFDSVLSDNTCHPDHPAWFAELETKKSLRPQDTTYLSNVAEYAGLQLGQLQEWLCGEDVLARADAYKIIGEYHGFENFDSDPLIYNSREAVMKRYEFQQQLVTLW